MRVLGAESSPIFTGTDAIRRASYQYATASKAFYGSRIAASQSGVAGALFGSYPKTPATAGSQVNRLSL
jgi:hypothetical protein